MVDCNDAPCWTINRVSELNTDQFHQNAMQFIEYNPYQQIH